MSHQLKRVLFATSVSNASSLSAVIVSGNLMMPLTLVRVCRTLLDFGDSWIGDATRWLAAASRTASRTAWEKLPQPYFCCTTWATLKSSSSNSTRLRIIAIPIAYTLSKQLCVLHKRRLADIGSLLYV